MYVCMYVFKPVSVYVPQCKCRVQRTISGVDPSHLPCLRHGLLSAPVYSRLASSRGSRDSPVYSSLLDIGALGINYRP